MVTGRFPAELHAAASQALEKAIDAEYKAIRPEPEVAESTVATAQRFVTAITELIGA